MINKVNITDIEAGFFKRGNPLKKLLKASLDIFNARQTGILFGTNKTGIKFLPTTMWDRGIIDVFYARGFKGLILALFGTAIVTAKKLSPIYFYKKDNNEKRANNEGIIAYILRNCTDYYKNGISAFLCPEIMNYIKENGPRYVYIPFYCYDGNQIKIPEEKIKLDTEIVKHFDARNYISIYLPGYGILTINTADESLLEIRDGKFVNEEELTNRLDILIKMVETASLASLGQLKGRAGAELLWRKETHLRRTSTKLAENEKKFRDLYDNAPIAYFSIDCDGIFQRCNSRAQELLGYEKSELLGKNAASILSNKDDISRIFNHINIRFKKNKTVTKMEIQQRNKTIGNIWLSLSIDTIKDRFGGIQEFRVTANDITDLKKLEKQLLKRTTELKRLNAHLISVEEEERKSIASDLHDSVAQTLGLCLSNIKNRQVNDFSDIQIYLKQSIKEVRSLIYKLSPPILNDFYIGNSLGFLIEESNEKHQSNIKYINQLKEPINTDQTLKVTLYRAVNELIINVIKHSGTKEAMVELSKNKDKIFIRIEDKGSGFDKKQYIKNQFQGFGIYSLSERMNNLKGNIEIFSKPGKGTKVILWAPIN